MELPAMKIGKPDNLGRCEITASRNGFQWIDKIDVAVANERNKYANAVFQKLRLEEVCDPDEEGKLIAAIEDAILKAAEDDPQVDRPAKKPQHFQPFPVSALPQPIRTFVESAAAAIGCESSYVALPLLCGLAGTVGATRRIKITNTWREPCVLWGAIVGESGSQKSPAQEVALRALEKLQAWQIEQLPELQSQYERDKMLYEADKRQWLAKGRAKNEPPPEQPAEPTCTRYIVSDQTVEALADRLSENQRGLLVANDELSSWLGGMNKYSAKGADETGQWLSMFNAGRLLIDRKTTAKKLIFVRHAAVSICGGITPGGFRRAIGGNHMENGLAARLLVAMPPRRPKRWTDREVSRATRKRIERLYGRLLALDFGADENDRITPIYVPLESDAAKLYQQFVNEHGQQQLDHAGHLSSVWSKLEATAARFALLFALVRWAEGEWPADSQVSATTEDVATGIELVRWFGAEWIRLYGTLHESDDEVSGRQLAEWIERKGGTVTAREVQQGHRQYQSADDAEAALVALVAAGYGEWQPQPPGPKGGRPTRVFRLLVPSTSTQPSNTLDSESIVDVDSVDDRSNGHSTDDSDYTVVTDDDW